MSKAFLGWWFAYTILILLISWAILGTELLRTSISADICITGLSLGVGACLSCITLDNQEDRREQYDKEDHDDEDNFDHGLGY